MNKYELKLNTRQQPTTKFSSTKRTKEMSRANAHKRLRTPVPNIFHCRIFVVSANREWYFHFNRMNWIRLSAWIFQFTRHSFELFAVCMIICKVSVHSILTHHRVVTRSHHSAARIIILKIHPANLRQYFEINILFWPVTPPLAQAPPSPHFGCRRHRSEWIVFQLAFRLMNGKIILSNNIIWMVTKRRLKCANAYEFYQIVALTIVYCL